MANELKYNKSKLEGVRVRMREGLPFPLRHPFRLMLLAQTNSGKSVWLEQFLDDQEDMIDIKMQGGVFYCHLDGEDTGDIRKQHIEKMRKSCSKFNVEFREISTNFIQFIATLKKNSLPRLLILDDMCQYVFKTPQGSELFNVVGHHYK